MGWAKYFEDNVEMVIDRLAIRTPPILCEDLPEEEEAALSELKEPTSEKRDRTVVYTVALYRKTMTKRQLRGGIGVFVVLPEAENTRIPAWLNRRQKILYIDASVSDKFKLDTYDQLLLRSRKQGDTRQWVAK